MNLKFLFSVLLVVIMLSSCVKSLSVKEKIQSIDPLLVPEELKEKLVKNNASSKDLQGKEKDLSVIDDSKSEKQADAPEVISELKPGEVK